MNPETRRVSGPNHPTTRDKNPGGSGHARGEEQRRDEARRGRLSADDEHHAPSIHTGGGCCGGGGGAGDGVVAEEGGVPGAQGVGRRRRPPPRAQARQRWHSEAPRGRADLRLQGRAGHVRDADVGAGGVTRPQAAASVAAQVAGGVARPLAVADLRKAVETTQRR